MMKSSKTMDLERETVASVSREYGIPMNEILKLDMNENLFVHRAFLRQILQDVVLYSDPRFYPINQIDELRVILASTINVQDEQILVGAGGDQIIDLIFRAFKKERRKVVTVDPTFSMYKKLCAASEIEISFSRLQQDFSLNLDEILDDFNSQDSILMLCSPNNPTGNQFPRETIQRLLDNYQGTLVIDEAYVDFAKFDLTRNIDGNEKLILIRSFSKSYGLAGLRLGYMISSSETIGRIQRTLQQPYPCSMISIETAIKVLQKQPYFDSCIKYTIQERDRLYNELNKLQSVQPFASDTNFILFSIEQNWRDVKKALMQRGIIVRGIGEVVGYPNCLRVTVGPRPMMYFFLDSLKEVLS